MYIIKKDGLYLMAYQYNGIKEYDSKGNYIDVPTGYYSADRRDAQVFNDTALADTLGAKAIRIQDKTNVRRNYR